MRTAELTDALLDYWTARAEGVPAADLELRAAGTLCVRVLRNGPAGIDGVMVLDYSTNWALCGPLVEKHRVDLMAVVDPIRYQAEILVSDTGHGLPHWRVHDGPTAMIAICRAVVHAAFGDEVEEAP